MSIGKSYICTDVFLSPSGFTKIRSLNLKFIYLFLAVNTSWGDVKEDIRKRIQAPSRLGKRKKKIVA